MSASVQDDSLSVAIRDGVALVEVHGRGSFKMGPSLKQFGLSAVTRHGCRRIVINMAECETMDSTFMGVVAGLAMRMKRDNDGRVVMVNLSERTRHLLATLGLDRVIRAYLVDQGPEDDLRFFCARGDLSSVDVSGIDRRQSVETMLNAHKDLVSAAPQNLARFQDVIEYLSRDAMELREENA